jgi:hypothetical protein
MLLDKHKLSIRPTHKQWFNGIRFSMHIFNIEKEIDFTANVLREELKHNIETLTFGWLRRQAASYTFKRYEGANAYLSSLVLAFNCPFPTKYVDLQKRKKNDQ